MTKHTSDTSAQMEINFRKLAGIAKLSEESALKLEKESQITHFRIGQAIAEETTLPAYAFWILEGECRLFGSDNTGLSSLGKIGPGASVGVASLLRAKPCERINASTPVTALAIPDELIVNFYENEPAFRNWCNQTIWPAELVSIVEERISNNAKNEISLQNTLARAIQTAKLITNQEQLNNASKENFSKDYDYILASGNTELKIGCKIACNQKLPTSRPPFSLRVIELPKDIYETSSNTSATEDNISKLNTSSNSPAILQRSGLDVGQSDLLRDFEIIKADGELDEVLACFQMISKQLKLPFRKDSIEKVLRDSLRRGQSPNIQLCGQLGASLGLHVTSANIPAEFGVRILTPSLVSWKGSFAIAIKSDSKGIVLASPKNGKIFISPEELNQEFPEGIDILLMERTINTPEQRFGPSWFMPALTRYRGVLTQVLIASFVVQLFGLANPLLIRVIIDKVISQRSLDTLQVLGVGLIIVTILEGILEA